MGCKSILLKGGHQETDMITSLYFDKTGRVYTFETEKFKTNNTHGSGCTLSSAIAAYIAQGKDLHDAVSMGQQYVLMLLKTAKT